MKKIRFQHPVLFWFGIVITSIFLLLGLSFLFIAYVLPLPDALANQKPTATTKIYDRKGVLLYEILQPESGKNTRVSLTSIPQHFIQATLAAEDINFYSHSGVDIFAIARALVFNLREQRIVSGASTIPIQLVRNMLGTTRARTYPEKFIEALYAVRLSHLYSKDQILELYLNRIYYGNMSYGSQAAALDYFGKPLKNLDLAESAFLAGLPQRPSQYNPFLYFDLAKKRQKYVLDQMVKYGFIETSEAQAAKEEPLKLRKNTIHMKAPHFVHSVINELSNHVDSRLITHGGLSVYTTLDYSLQQNAERIVEHHVDRLHDKNVTNGALLSIKPQSGQILAWVGSKDYFDENIDGAVDIITSLRQPGSAIKPLTYLLALEKGYTPATVIEDIPTDFATASGPYSPKNYDLTFHGPVRLRNALASSFNVPAVKTLEFVGLENFLFFLKKLGIDTFEKDPDFYGLALTLGGGDMRMFDLAKAYNVLANYGSKKELSSILKIETSDGEELYNWAPPAEEHVLGPYGEEHAYQIIDILKDPLARLGGFGEGSVLELSREAAVKTGTTRNFRDNWTVGFTPELLTAVWVGNADSSPMESISGVDGAGPIWHDFMESVLSSFKPTSFQRPSFLKQIEICAISGLLPTEYCQERVYEWFVPGTEPKEPDNYYKPFWLHKGTGNLIEDACKNKYLEKDLEKKVIVIYPQTLQKWAYQNGLQTAKVESCVSNDYPDGYSSDQAPKGNTSPDRFLQNKDRVIITDSPNHKDEYLLDNSLPLEDQKIPFRATVPMETQEVKYFVDNQEVGTVKERPFSFLWLPQPGEHTFQAEAKLADGKIIKSNKTSFRVH